MFIVEAFFFKAALRATPADKIGAETPPKHAPWKAGLTRRLAPLFFCVTIFVERRLLVIVGGLQI